MAFGDSNGGLGCDECACRHPWPRGLRSLQFTQTREAMPLVRGTEWDGSKAVVRTAAVSADKCGMKPTAVQYPHPLPMPFAEFARATTRHGFAAYALSLAVAAAALAASVFFREISDTFGRELMGVRAIMLWEAALLVVALVWLTGTGLALFCLPQKGRPRALGAWSIGINAAAALLVVVTLL